MQNPPVVWTPDSPLADFTSDGILDQISSDTGEVVVLPGRSDGTFGNPIRTAIPYLVHEAALAVADFNNDGALDVFTSEYNYDAQWYFANVLLGNGQGHFGLWESLQFGGYHGNYIGTGNIFGTGGTDVVYQAGYDFDTGEQLIAVLFNIDDWGPPPPPPPPATPHLRIDPAAVWESNAGAVVASFTVRLSVAGTETITVDYATADGSATGGDYQAVSGTLTFAPGEMSKTITVTVNGDRLPEPDETFVVSLSNSTNATIASGQGTGTIRDDEPRISISDVTKSEGKKGRTTLFTFTVMLSAPFGYDQPVTMSFKTVNGSATTSNGDYVAKTGTLTFAPGETTKTITIDVKGDSKREANETFYLDLFGLSSNALFTKNRGIGTILNDD